MDTSQLSNSVKTRPKPTPTQRIIAGSVFLVVLLGAFILFAGAKGWLELSAVFGVCGFQQHYGLPCPGCYWTRAAQAYVTGHILRAFVVQPAAAAACVAVTVITVFALLTSVFGVHCPFFCRPWNPKTVKVFIFVGLFMILAGWVVTLARAFAQWQ